MVTGVISKYYIKADFDETIRCPILTIMSFIFVLYEVGEICRKYLHRNIVIFLLQRYKVRNIERYGDFKDYRLFNSN